MELTILKVSPLRPSKYGKKYRYVFMKDEKEGRSYKTVLFEDMRNYQRWQHLLEPGNVIAGCRVKKGNLIDADSQVWLKGKVKLEEH